MLYNDMYQWFFRIPLPLCCSDSPLYNSLVFSYFLFHEDQPLLFDLS